MGTVAVGCADLEGMRSLPVGMTRPTTTGAVESLLVSQSWRWSDLLPLLHTHRRRAQEIVKSVGPTKRSR